MPLFKLYFVLFLISFLSIQNLTSQTNVLYFDGEDDYVNLFSDMIHDVRSIEMWFKLADDIGPSLSEPLTILGRENQIPQNDNEFYLTFVPENWTGSGSLRFTYCLYTDSIFTVYSNINYWPKDVWYHVAITIDADQGLLMFINGVKQLGHEPLMNFPIPMSNEHTILGCWGTGFERYFNGWIDDLRISYEAIYLDDFEPPCPDIALADSTTALYHFNESSGFTAFDSGPYGYDGLVNGPLFELDTICINVGINNQDEFCEGVIIYPNPVTSTLNLMLPCECQGILQCLIYDNTAKLIRTTSVECQAAVSLSRKGLNPGMYMFILKNDKKIFARSSFIVN